MNKFKIAIAAVLMFAGFSGMSAQKALQAEIQKVKQQTEEAAGVISSDAKKAEMKLEKKSRELKKDFSRKGECKKGECKKGECKKGEAKCKKGEFGKCSKGEMKVGKKPGCKTETMFEGLNLTTEQQSKIKELCAKRQEKVAAEKAAKTSEKAAKAEKRAAERAQFDAELQKILTPEQYKEFQAKKEGRLDKKEKGMKKMNAMKDHSKEGKKGKK